MDAISLSSTLGDLELSRGEFQELQSIQYVLTRIGSRKLAFAAVWVSEIVPVERSQILSLPFYDAQLLGLFHHQGTLIPLIAATDYPGFQERWAAICLSSAAGDWAGAAVAVEQVLGGATETQRTEPDAGIELFEPETLNRQICHPQRWRLS
jgi:hypothetical protein